MARRRKKNPAAVKGDDYMFIALGIGGLYVLYQLVQGIKGIGSAAAKLPGQVASAATGAVTGKNSITENTPYYGTGIIGNAAAVTDAAFGGALSSGGSVLGSWLYDISNPTYDPNAKTQAPNQLPSYTAPLPVDFGVIDTSSGW